jgi:L-iditol 2-dehydrogenase
MRGVRLHGPRDLRVEDLPDPPPPDRGEVLIRVTAAGICGSDLHSYNHARIGDTPVTRPLVLGHEFAGVVERCGSDAFAGDGRPLFPGLRVAVDPASPCMKCDMCLKGDTHICRNLHFCGLAPDDGCFCERLVAPAHSCFILPEGIDDESGALLEPLGVAMHAAGKCRIMQGDSVAIFGAGPIGLLILQVALRAGAAPVIIVEPLLWRRALAAQFGGTIVEPRADPVASVFRLTGGKGVDVAVEAAWADSSVQSAAASAAPGGRVVLVGIPGDDRLTLDHSTARRKELTLAFSRRMKNTYPAAIRMVRENLVDLKGLITHRFPLSELPAAFALNAGYNEQVVKVMITYGGNRES